MDGVEGVDRAGDGRSHLRARVRAVPEKGGANRALARLLADALEVPQSSVEIISGATARLKTVRISGDATTIETRLAALAGSGKLR